MIFFYIYTHWTFNYYNFSSRLYVEKRWRSQVSHPFMNSFRSIINPNSALKPTVTLKHTHVIIIMKIYKRTKKDVPLSRIKDTFNYDVNGWNKDNELNLINLRSHVRHFHFYAPWNPLSEIKMRKKATKWKWEVKISFAIESIQLNVDGIRYKQEKLKCNDDDDVVFTLTQKSFSSNEQNEMQKKTTEILHFFRFLPSSRFRNVSVFLFRLKLNHRQSVFISPT